MDYRERLEEITAQWGGDGALSDDDARAGLADMLATVSMVAERSLAHVPSGREAVTVAAAAVTVGGLSARPRTVLRKLMVLAECQYGWVPTGSVLRAAGRVAP